ncbi:hypothetical protein D7V86_11280 [bacterium D16-51]|nr:hypothetical protein D7V96_12800 [bacterium D16-59]RKI59752.1 hypothetical protein D7V86_11280 [bacterium D16-51]
MRWYKKLFIVLAFILGGACFVFFGLKIDTVKVEGTEIYSGEEIEKSVFTREFSDNILFFSIYNKIFGINKLPFVEDIEVSFENMHTVKLHVYDKAISGCIQYMGQYIYFDRDGIVLQSMQEKKEGVPVVTGIHFVAFSVGEAFDVKDNSLFAMVMNLSQLISHYKIPVKRIHISDGDVVLYSGDIVVMLGKKELYDDEISALSSILETAGEKGLRGTIDMKSFRPGDRVILNSTDKAKKKKNEKKERDKEG